MTNIIWTKHDRRRWGLLYEKSIVYVDYFDRGIRRKNIGFVKIRKRNGGIKLTINLKNVPLRGSVACRIMEENSERELDTFTLEDGMIIYENSFPAETFDVKILKFVFEEDKYGIAEIGTEETPYFSKAVNEMVEDKIEHQMKFVSEQEIETVTQDYLATNKRDKANFEEEVNHYIEKDKIETTDTILQESRVQQKVDDQEHELEITEESSDSESMIEEHEIEGTEIDFLQEVVRNANNEVKDMDTRGPRNEHFLTSKISTNKWQQLCNMYQKVHPFQKEIDGEFITIEPKDFVVLQSSYQTMVNNSFLLHGYYNYQHIILGKVLTQGSEKYYVGVPGNYYDREKRVAAMFGFEGFESVEEFPQMEPIPQGTFGYYMCTVAI